MVEFDQGGSIQQDKSGVPSAYRCPDCGRRREARRPDDAHDGVAGTRAGCGASVQLEWDGGMTLVATGAMRRLRPS
ncbi:hypothetical protein WT05_15560 [Burkholderia stagnalis]|nr:hypothetical protein WT05_15560 [Burkholderia stagnalis]